MFRSPRISAGIDRWTQTSATATVLALSTIAAVLVACGPAKLAVCTGQAEHVVIVPSTSKSERDTSVALTPDIADQAIRRAVCGRLTVGVMTNNPERDLELRSRDLVPDRTEAYNTAAVIDQVVDDARPWVQEQLLTPLELTEPTGGSPFMTTYAKIGREVRAHGWDTPTVISIGDGLVAEPSPSGVPIRLGTGSSSVKALDEFVPDLKSLQGACVLLIGSGATDETGPPAESIRQAQQLLGETLRKAGVGFVATTSRDVPPNCSEG